METTVFVHAETGKENEREMALRAGAAKIVEALPLDILKKYFGLYEFPKTGKSKMNSYRITFEKQDQCP
jgi:hypothetical protein